MFSLISNNAKDCEHHVQPSCVLQELAAVAIVQVRACQPGEVSGSGNETCELCPITQYSFDPFSGVCSTPCPLHANCSGGSALVPVPGYYHSAPNSTIMHSCPNPAACG